MKEAHLLQYHLTAVTQRFHELMHGEVVVVRCIQTLGAKS